MCDYSLMAIPNRLAVPGDDLVIHRFGEGALGMAAAFDIQAKRECRKKQGFWPRLKEFFKQDPGIPAVCIPPSSHLIVRDIPQDLQRKVRSDKPHWGGGFHPAYRRGRCFSGCGPL